MRKNVFKKYLSGLLAMLMAIGLIPIYTKPMTVQAANDVKTMNLNTSYLAPSDGTWDAGSDHKIYFGQYDGTPTAFRVLKVEGGTMMLDCDTILLSKKFNENTNANTEQTSGNVNEWTGSDLEKWLNDTDYYGNTSIFTTVEKNTILQTTLAASDTDYVIEGSEVSNSYKDYKANDYVYLLSAKEADALYADDDARVKLGSEFWWLRSAYAGSGEYSYNFAGIVWFEGAINTSYVSNEDIGVSPAFNLNQASILFTSAVDVNKSSDTLTNIQAADGTKEWKLTLLDPKRTVKVVNDVSTSIIRSGNTISVPYKNEGPSAEQISVMITNGAYAEAGTEILYYGKLTEDKTSGGVISKGFFTLPDGLPAGYRIYILAEDINGEKYTDYASAPAEVTVPELVEAPIANLTEDTYTSDQSLILTSATAGADIHYTMTTDGSEPDDPDPYIPSEYNGAILLTGTVGNSTTYKIKALAAKTYTNVSSISSFTYTISIPETYEVTVANGTGGGEYKEGETVTITADPPESGKQFKEWTGVDGLTFTDETDKTSPIAKFTMPANAVSVTAAYEDIPKEAVPTATVDYINESLTGLNAGAKYTVNDKEYTADSNGNISIDSSWIGTAVEIIKAASDANHIASDVQSLVIPVRPAEPNVQGVNTSYADTMDGKITGVTTAMEYRKSTGGTWTSCAVDEVTGLEAGTYEVRVKASDSSFAGLVTNVTVAAGPARTYTLTVTAPKFENVHYGYAQPTAKPITITSSGNSDTTITSVTIDGTNFTITEGTSPVTAGEKNETYKIQPIAGLEAGVYSATITVTYQNGTATVTDEVSISVEKAEQQAPAAPTVASHTKDSIILTNTPDSIESGAKAEYSKDNGSTWQDSPVFEGLNGTAAYNFVVRYRANGNYNVSANSEVLTAQISHSYTNSVTQEATCQEEGIRTYTCSCGDSYTETIAVKPNNHDLGHYEEKAPTYTEIGWNAYDECRRIGCDYTTYQELPKLVDNIAPTGTIVVKENKWTSFIHTITFGIFAKDKFEVTITAEDKETGVKSVEYICSEESISETDIVNVTTWNEYAAFSLENEGKYIIYAKITDDSNNATYISSDGMVVDQTAPVIGGITDGRTYCSEQSFTVEEENAESVIVNGTEVTGVDGTYTLAATGTTYKIAVTDKAGNTTTATVTVNNGHTFTNYVSNNDATCTADGTKTAKCDYCVATDTKTDTGSMRPHTMTHTEAVESTCMDKGNVEYWTCSECKKIYDSADGGNTIADVVTAINPNNHKPSEDWTQENDKHYHVCVNGCGTHLDETDCSGGTATCTGKAVCEVCEKEYGTVLGHDFTGDFDAYDENGHWHICNREGCEETDMHKPHSFTNYEYNDDATYLTDGTETAVCDAAGCNAEHSRTKEGSKLTDNIAPTGTIAVKENKWTSFIHTITFGIFAKDKFDVTITAEDKETGVKSVEYICSETPISETDILAVADWKNYSAFSLAEEGKYIVYAKITDNSNNITYISSNGMVVDRTVPVIDNTEYAITAGDDQTIKRNFDGTVTITCNGELSKFIRVSVDGTKVDSKNYTLKSGSTILTFTKEYIASLSVGTHVVRFEYIDGYVETKLTIAKADDTNNKNPADKPNQDKDAATDEKKPTTEASPLEAPKTDENTPLGLMITLFVSLLAGAILIEAYCRKKKAE